MWFRNANGRELCAFEGACVLRLVDVAPARVRARLEYRPEAAIRVPLANAVNGLAHGRRMMREVVDHEDAIDLTANLLSALHALERGESGSDLVGTEAKRPRGGEHTDRILNVVVAGHRQQELARTPERFVDREPGALGAEAQAFDAIVCVAVCGVRRHEGARGALRDLHGVRI